MELRGGGIVVQHGTAKMVFVFQEQRHTQPNRCSFARNGNISHIPSCIIYDLSTTTAYILFELFVVAGRLASLTLDTRESFLFFGSWPTWLAPHSEQKGSNL